MQVEQYVMAYGIEQDRIRAIIPEGFVSLRPVLRINAEIQDNSNGYLEFNTPVEKDNAKGRRNTNQRTVLESPFPHSAT